MQYSSQVVRSKPKGMLIQHKRIKSSKVVGVLSIDGIQLVNPQVSHQYQSCRVKWASPVMLRWLLLFRVQEVSQSLGDLSFLASEVSRQIRLVRLMIRRPEMTPPEQFPEVSLQAIQSDRPPRCFQRFLLIQTDEMIMLMKQSGGQRRTSQGLGM